MPDPLPTTNRQTGPKRGYLLRRDFESTGVGFTPGCPVFDVYRTAGVRPKGLSHSEVCRARTERALAKHPEAKIRMEQAALRNEAELVRTRELLLSHLHCTV